MDSRAKSGSCKNIGKEPCISPSTETIGMTSLTAILPIIGMASTLAGIIFFFRGMRQDLQDIKTNHLTHLQSSVEKVGTDIVTELRHHEENESRGFDSLVHEMRETAAVLRDSEKHVRRKVSSKPEEKE